MLEGVRGNRIASLRCLPQGYGAQEDGALAVWLKTLPRGGP